MNEISSFTACTHAHWWSVFRVSGIAFEAYRWNEKKRALNYRIDRAEV